MRKRIGVATAAVVGAVAVTAGVSQAGIPTEIVLDNQGTQSGDPATSFIVGHLTNPNAKCLSARKIEVRFGYQNESKARLVDSGRSTDQGTFSGAGPTTHDANAIDFARVLVASKTIGRKHHRKICASIQADFPIL